jgi:CRISPR-associated protein Cas5h
MPKLVVFEVGSTLGYFRKAFTTTNALTHSVIPRSAVEGLIGAILGRQRNEYPQQLQHSNIAVEIRSPVRKLSMKYMHINHEWFDYISHYLDHRNDRKEGIKYKMFTIPVSVEFLRYPIYRIYVNGEQFNDELAQRLENKQTHYTPFLGTSSMICYIRHLETTTYKTASFSQNEYVHVSSVIPFFSKIPKVRLERNLQYAMEDGLPIHIDNQRISSGTYRILYSPEMSKIEVADEHLIECKIDCMKVYVKFLPTEISS